MLFKVALLHRLLDRSLFFLVSVSSTSLIQVMPVMAIIDIVSPPRRQMIDISSSKPGTWLCHHLTSSIISTPYQVSCCIYLSSIISKTYIFSLYQSACTTPISGSIHLTTLYVIVGRIAELHCGIWLNSENRRTRLKIRVKQLRSIQGMFSKHVTKWEITQKMIHMLTRSSRRFNIRQFTIVFDLRCPYCTTQTVL